MSVSPALRTAHGEVSLQPHKPVQTTGEQLRGQSHVVVCAAPSRLGQKTPRWSPVSVDLGSGIVPNEGHGDGTEVANEL